MKKEQLMIVDGHVHIHSCFDIPTMLDAALANFRRLECNNAAYFIALSESRSQNYFACFQQLALSSCDNATAEEDSFCSSYQQSVDRQQSIDVGDWQVFLTAEPDALVAKKPLARKPLARKSSAKEQVAKKQAAKQSASSRDLESQADGGEATIYILAGRQIVTEENLEVLALATGSCFDDGHPLEETVHWVIESGGVPVIPWGFGKWIGRRGQHLHCLLQSPPLGLFLADSSSRPAFWSEPLLFEQARRRGLAILNGTDPFPLKSEMNRAGLAGFKIAGQLDTQQPATSLRRSLQAASRVLREASSSSPSKSISTDVRSGGVRDGGVQSDGLQSDGLQSDGLETDKPSNAIATIYPLPSVYGPLETPFRCFRNQLAMQFIKRFRSHA